MAFTFWTALYDAAPPRFLYLLAFYFDLTVILTPARIDKQKRSARHHAASKLTVIVDLVLLEHGIPANLLQLGMHPGAVDYKGLVSQGFLV